MYNHADGGVQFRTSAHCSTNSDEGVQFETAEVFSESAIFTKSIPTSETSLSVT